MKIKEIRNQKDCFELTKISLIVRFNYKHINYTESLDMCQETIFFYFVN